jgi:hypothetical protein
VGPRRPGEHGRAPAAGLRRPQRHQLAVVRPQAPPHPGRSRRAGKGA